MSNLEEKEIEFCVNRLNKYGDIEQKEYFKNKKEALNRAKNLRKKCKWNKIDVEKQTNIIDSCNGEQIKISKIENIKQFQVKNR